MPEAWRPHAGFSAFLIVALMSVAAPAADRAPPPERQAELMHRLRHDCGSCHGLTMKGGLGPALLPATLADKDAQSLATIMRDGVPGTPMPPWGFELNEAEALWLALQLKQGLAP